VKKERFSVEQITSVLQQVEGRVPVGDVCRHVGRDAVADWCRASEAAAMKERTRDALCIPRSYRRTRAIAVRLRRSCR
jgi:hypothetical protein